MPLAAIHAKRFTNSLSCDQVIGRSGIDVGTCPRVLNGSPSRSWLIIGISFSDLLFSG